MGSCYSRISERQGQSSNVRLTDSYQMGDLTLKNRVVMASLTRCRADPETGIPNNIMKQYYGQRAGFGLIITEGSEVTHLTSAFPGSGAIYSDSQIEGWKKIVDAVHAQGSKIFIQLYHGGRTVPLEFSKGQQPIAPSAIAIPSDHMFLKKPYPVPREMTQRDIDQAIEDFKNAAIRAKKAGFDGVQLHAANGFLVDQFLRDNSNKRQDKYGGSIPNRCRFLFEVIDALASVYGYKRVSVRFSPTGRYNQMYDSDPLTLMKFALGELSKKNLAFVEIKRHAKTELGDQNDGSTVDSNGLTKPQFQIPNFFQTLRQFYSGVLMGNDGFDPESALSNIKQGNVDLVSFGSLAIVNPDLVERIKNGWELNTTQDMATWFAGGEKGYLDFEPYRV